jgi:rhodanese-related sulfurtransferase
MTEVRTAHTADLDTAILGAARALLGDVFEDLTEYDWEHALGGIHALVWEGPQLIGHASFDPTAAAPRWTSVADGLCRGRRSAR